MMDSGEQDETLIGRYVHGDVAAFTLLYKRHEMRVWRYLKRNVDNRATADELLQEVWFAVARDAPRYQPSARFTSWLFSIAHNRMIDCVRASAAATATRAAGSLSVTGRRGSERRGNRGHYP
jgi:RNA polymerase sigma factor (sigma-70 family)